MALRELNFELTFDSQIRRIREANTAFDRMRNEALGAGRNIDTLERNSGRLGRTLKGVGLLAGTVLAGLTAKVGFDFFIKGNADMETFRNTLTVVMKDADKANEALTWATKFAATTPFEVPGIVEATTRLATYGIEAQNTLPIIGDMAATMGKDIMQAVEAVADAQTGELERLKEFGITKGMLQEQADAMGIIFQNNKGQITSYENLNSALFTLMEDRYKGSMEMQSKTFKGMMSNAKDMMGNVGRTVGAPIFEAFKDSLEGLLETANGLMESGKLDEWANNVANAIEDMRSKVDMAVGVYKALKSNLDVIAPIITSIGLAIFAVKIPAIVAWTFATQAQIVAQWALIAPMIATMAPIIAVGLAIGALIYIWKNYGEAIKEYAVGAWNSVQTQFNQIVSFVEGINLWEVGANIIKGLVDGMTSMLDSAMETARNIGSGIAGTLKSFFGIQSPSKLMFQYGGFIGEGLDMGMQSKTTGLKATSQGMAEATDKQFTSTTTSSSSSYAPSINITVNGSGGGARETANMVRKEVKNVLDAQNRKMMLRVGV